MINVQWLMINVQWVMSNILLIDIKNVAKLQHFQTQSQAILCREVIIYTIKNRVKYLYFIYI